MVKKKTKQASSLNMEIEQEVRRYLDVIDELRSAGLEQCSIELPSIAVIGDQSSGKSSVLEALTGIQFPRGTGLVTRCATEVRMTKAPEKKFWKAFVYTSKDSESKEEVDDKNKIGDVITRLTESLCEPGCLSDETIVIELKASEVPDLTIIDLPGLTRARTTEQSAGFKNAVENLVKRYVYSNQTINLCVVPANADIATAGSFQYAEDADPKGERTIGVLTKVDLIDAGTEDVNVIAILENRIKPLKLGYVAVRNRGDQDLKNKVSLEEAKINEMNFFSSNEKYKALIDQGKSYYFGSGSLAKKLTEVLVKRIIDLVPSLRKQIFEQISECKEQLKHFGSKISEENLLVEFNQTSRSFYNIVHEATNEATYRKEPLLGTWADVNNQKDKEDLIKLRMYSRTDSSAFRKFNTFAQDMKPNFDSEEYIKTIQHESIARKGRLLPGFMNANLFRELASSMILKLKSGTLELLQTVRSFLNDCVKTIIKKTTNRYPRFPNVVEDTTADTLEILEEKTMMQLNRMFESEEVPYTLNSSFSKELDYAKTRTIRDHLMKCVEENKEIFSDKRKLLDQIHYARGKRDTAELQEAKLLNNYLKEYWNYRVPHLVDSIIKCVDTELMRPFGKQWLKRMEAKTFDKDWVVSIMKEDASVTRSRTVWAEKEKRLLLGKAALLKLV